MARWIAVAAAMLLAAACATEDGPRPAAGTLFVLADGEVLAVDGSNGEVEHVSGPLKDTWYVPSPNGQWLLLACGDDTTAYIGADDIGLCAYGPDGYVQLTTSKDLERPGFTETDWGSLVASWRPDGNAVAFLVRERAREDVYSSGDIYVLELGPRTVLRVSEGAYAEGRLWMRWSPDGARLATANSANIGQGVELEVIDVATRTSIDAGRELPGEGLIEQYAWSPDSSALAFTYNVGSVSLYAVSSDGTNLRELTSAWGGTEPTWSPDGEWIAAVDVFSAWAQAFIVRSDGSGRREIGEGLHSSDHPAWSPDGRRIAFAGAAESAPSPNDFPVAGILVFDLASGERRSLTSGGPSPAPFPIVTFSRDGKHIFYTADAPPCREGCPPGRLFMVDAEGNEPPRKLTDALVSELLSWHP